MTKKNTHIPLFKGVYRANTAASGTAAAGKADRAPEAEELKALWSNNWRPNVVLCITCDAKLLLCYSAQYDLWQLPQGGVEPGETLEHAFLRELSEELGSEFASSCGLPVRYLGRDKVEFRSPKTVEATPVQGEPEEVSIRGKAYFISHIASLSRDVQPAATQFDDLKWCSADEAQQILDRVYQAGKKRVSLKAVASLRQQGLL